MAAAHKASELGSLRSKGRRALKLAAVVAVATTSCAAHAQAKPGASRSAEISAYGGISYAKPDFGPSSINNKGGEIGFVYTRFIHFPVEPSLDLRGTYNTGNTVTMKSFTAGIRGTYDFVDKYDFRDRLHPYVAVYGGEGTIKYDHALGIPSDRAFILAGAIGINVDAYKHFQVLADASLQNWNFGKNGFLKPNGENFTLSPKGFTVGITYRLPAHSRSKIADTR